MVAGSKNPSPQGKYVLRREQVAIFRLRTNHNRLNAHLFKKFKIGASPLCTCGVEEQTAEHVLQNCTLLEEARNRIWPEPTSLETKLYGTLEDLRSTTDFLVLSPDIAISREERRRRSDVEQAMAMILLHSVI